MSGTKIGRNEPCPCGSELKYKKCCLKKAESPKNAQEIPAHVIAEAGRRFQEHDRAERERLAKFGEIRPVIWADLNGQRFVTVRNRLYYSDRWKFFPDFLRDYVMYVFGEDWFQGEMAKDETNRHPLIHWRTEAFRFMQAQPARPDGTYAAVPNGFLAAYLAFSYDLYVIQDNSRLDEHVLTRLRNHEQFQGARHEIFTEATCLRAGFKIEREDEGDPTRRHAEFSATHEETGITISVEAKSRHRPGVLGRPGIAEEPDRIRLRFGDLLNDAIAKHPAHPLAVFIDTNLPLRAAERLYTPQTLNPFAPSRIMGSLIGRVIAEHHGTAPYALLVFSNHPHYYARSDEADPRRHLLSIEPRTQPEVRRRAILELHQAADMYGNVPNEFPKDVLSG